MSPFTDTVIMCGGCLTVGPDELALRTVRSWNVPRLFEFLCRGGGQHGWTSKSKDISITSTTDHPSSQAGVIARPPGVTTINFTPAEFFGAAARCCHLHVINPALVTAEIRNDQGAGRTICR